MTLTASNGRLLFVKGISAERIRKGIKVKKKFKTVVIHRFSGKPIRITKSDVIAVHEQRNIGGGIDTGVFMKSGCEYWVSESKAQVEDKIFN